MVNQLLAMARAEDTGQAARHKAVDLAAITRAVVRDFVPRAIERHIDLGFEGVDGQKGSPGTRLMAEPVLVSEMVRNLVDNALHYTPSGGTVTARVFRDPQDQAVVLQVEDTGPGIAPAEREAIFRPFYRVPDTQVDGSGLGLAIVHEVAEHHAAQVTVSDARPRDNEAGLPPGALFTVRFPMAATPPAVAAGSALHEAPAARHGHQDAQPQPE
jgi:two-component system sensor histidine kinase TctE